MVVMEILDGTQQQKQLAEVKVCAHLVFSVWHIFSVRTSLSLTHIDTEASLAETLNVSNLATRVCPPTAAGCIYNPS